MTCPHCHQPACATTATLISGQEVCTWSDEYRHECEARAVLAMQPLAARQEYLFGRMERVFSHGKWIDRRTVRGIQQVRGDAALERLKTTMKQLWDLGAAERCSRPKRVQQN